MLPALRACSKCGESPRAFYPKGLHSWCLGCQNKARRDWEDNNGGRRFLRYRLTEEDIYYMWLHQGGRCFCGDLLDITKPESFHVDHDNSCCSKEITRVARSCGKCVRGLLCGPCNQGLGNFKDEVQRLKGAIAYLTQMEGSVGI